MAVVNIHSRQLPVAEDEVGGLIDSLAGVDDRLWPQDSWPPMRFDRPLGVGAVGGHGPVRYTVEGYQPGRWIRFRFTGPRGFDGFHEFTVHPGGDGTAELRHLLAMRARGPARFTWPLVFRRMHDACLEDSLDRAEREVTGTVRTPARWSPLVRALRAGIERFAAR
ncbi:SRPBCC family protein [Nocardia mexicana]|uniref:Polyketide cyclase/dehydrase/lipid transport protein n=1 Tax=Nocardia mexicana TaxID=279262 RepID=A0A370GZN4_9NOCA|nr:SRPBCC family protein [Nocardia mexicana]RDI49140.1 polyketide cyclase/dehydrase/lipid transport protein [Nocardia mexicana]